MSQSSDQTRFFVLRRGKCHHLTSEEIHTIVAAGNDGQLLVCDTVIDSTGVLRTMSIEERRLLPTDPAYVRVTSNTDHTDQRPGEIFIGYYSDDTIHNSGSIGWKKKRVGDFSSDKHEQTLHGIKPVFVDQDEIFPGSYVPKK